METTATNALGQVRLLEDVHSGGPKNHMPKGTVVAIVPSPVGRMNSHTWVKGPEGATRLIAGEYEKI